MKQKKKKTAIIIIITLLILSPILLNVAVMIANNFIAISVRNELRNLPLPEDTEIVSSYSVAGKVVGNGNGMQYFGAILLESELTLEELSEHYLNISTNYWVREQVGREITVLDHRSHQFNIKDEVLVNHYILHTLSGGTSEFLREFDLRGR
jgi:hypothetical protein